MNIEEAKSNIGKEVIYIGNDKEVISAFNGKKLIISYPTKNMKTSVIIENDELCFWNIEPQDLKLKEQPMNYKIKVTPETSAEVQELFFELGYGWNSGNNIPKYKNNRYIHTIDKNIIVTNSEEVYNDLKATEITLPQLRDLVVLKRNDVGDATHEHSRSGNKYYRGFEDYCFSGIEWILTDITFPNSLKPINREITWQDALRYLENGEDVEFYNQTTKVWHNLLDSTIRTMRSSNGKFRLKPQTIYIDGGDYTKDELLKIVGEMG